METLIFDTSALLNFGHRGEMEFLLARLAGGYHLVTTEAVVRELTKPELSEFYRSFLKENFAVRSSGETKLSLEKIEELSGILGSGELSVILLAAETKAIAVLDETAARRETGPLGIRTAGTLGLLEACRKKGWIKENECMERLSRLRKAGFRIRKPGANETFAEYFSSLGGKKNKSYLI